MNRFQFQFTFLYIARLPTRCAKKGNEILLRDKEKYICSNDWTKANKQISVEEKSFIVCSIVSKFHATIPQCNCFWGGKKIIHFLPLKFSRSFDL